MKKRMILIIEDEAEMVKMMKMWLKAHRYQCITAMTVEEGLEKAITLQPQLVLLDIMLPQLSGLEFLKRRQANAQLQGIPVILLTVLSDEKIIEEGLAMGASAYLNKLCDTEEILFAINEYALAG